MTSREKRTHADLIVVIILIVVLLLILFALLSGVVWIELDIPQLGLWINVLLPLEIAVIAVVFTYSLVRYTQYQYFRDLALILIALNAMFLVLFYLLTNVSAIDWSPFASRERNRTIVTAFSFIVGPPLLFGSLTEEIPVSKRQKDISVVYGALITPSISTWLFLSPEPVFITSLPEGGITGITPIAWIILIFTGVTMTAALVKSIQSWRRKHNRINMSVTMALAFWILSIILFSTQRSPYQVMELVWIGSMTYGFLVIAVAMIITAVVEPHKALVGLVEERTSEVETSRKESEFYLALWGHKIGNLLQGMTMYLELLALPNPEDTDHLRESAWGLSREAALINRQVGILAQLKESAPQVLIPQNIGGAIHRALETVGGLISPDTINLLFQEDNEEVWIKADGLLEAVFLNLLSFISRSIEKKEIDVSIGFVEIDGYVDIQVAYSGNPLSEDIETSVFHELNLLKTTLNLDLYSVKILMDYYEGTFEYHRLDEPDSNQFVLRFKSADQVIAVDKKSQSDNLNIVTDNE